MQLDKTKRINTSIVMATLLRRDVITLEAFSVVVRQDARPRGKSAAQPAKGVKVQVSFVQ